MDTTTNTNTNTNNAKVEIYSTPTCHFCHMAKDWLTEKGVPYVDYNVAQDMDKRKEMVEITGQMGVPVIKVGNDVMIGFDPTRLAELAGVKE
ncbi:MAG: Glutaredoxin-like protein YruB-family [Candidatus Nomurabacteria bacterium]|nr:Glutaredoxin-like protein YruB-family [Candidatus Nomurabacteria bacterium]